jgi:aspartate aminotransferase
MQRVVKEVIDDHVDISIYQRRRDRLSEILEEAGYTFAIPQGTFYFFPQSPVPDDTKFVRMLQKERILTVPGRGFGVPGYFRIAFCVDDKVIERSKDGFKKAMELATK